MTDAKLERFTAGDSFAVDPDAIERELASLWQAAGREAASSEQAPPVTRACLVNVVALLEEREGREGFGSADALQQWIDDLPRHVAARALVVRQQTGGADRQQPGVSGGPALESWISANCILADGGGKMVCSEEVTIAARGDADHHVPGLLRALLVPGLPTALLTRGIPYGALAEPILELADRVISDVDASSHPAPITTLGQLARDGLHSGVDLGWVGTASLRAALAGAFDPPFDPQGLLAIRQLHCITPPAVQWSNRLLMGWLAQGFGAEDPVAVGQGESKLQRADGAPLVLKLTIDPEAPGPSFRFDAEGWTQPLRVACLGSHIEVDGPHFRTTRHPRQEQQGAAAVARALLNRSEDLAFRRAIDIAEFL